MNLNVFKRQLNKDSGNKQYKPKYLLFTWHCQGRRLMFLISNSYKGLDHSFVNVEEGTGIISHLNS